MGGQWHKIGDKGGKTSGRRTHHPTQAHICGETRGDKTSGRRASTPSNTGAHVRRQWDWDRTQWETMGDKGRQDLGKADIPSNKGRQEGIEGGHTIQHRHTCGETMGDNRRQGETRPREGRHTIQQRETRRETRGDKASETQEGTQGETRPRKRGDTIQHRHTCGETMRDNGRQWGTRPWEGPGLRQGFYPPSRGICFPFNAASIPSLFAAC